MRWVQDRMPGVGQMLALGRRNHLLERSGLGDMLVGVTQGLVASPTATLIVAVAVLGYREPDPVRGVLLLVGAVAGTVVSAGRRRQRARAHRGLGGPVAR